MATKKKVETGFHSEGVMLSLAQLLPSKQLTSGVKATVKYKRIEASIGEVGIIEPLIVFPQNPRARRGANRKYLVLDGHLRLEVLRGMKAKTVFCLVAKEDEGYTYNRHVNRLSSIQEHFMIMKALRNGVPEERLAKALSIELKTLRNKTLVIKGICDEAVDILKDKEIGPAALKNLKQAKAIRQIEMAELMVAARNYTSAYSRALFLATPIDLLVESGRKKKVGNLSEAEVARMERELQSVETDIRLVEQNYGENVLNLVLARGYLARLLDNAKVVRYLSRNHPDILEQFQHIIEVESLDG